ncbi:nesprin-2-like [Solea senegalensis]|uniref:Nesprin-2-like n=1 Tax=Solea senegalensis TaxID=28829 RepID=A0AAV6RYX7_SOLSE|nr:nesprin-2-like [Solea senegalensis]
MLLQVEQEQIQKRTFTNWVNAQLAKRRPPCRIVDLFNDFRDGSMLLDLLEVMSNQHISRERGRGVFQHRSNIEKALAFLKKKSIKLVNINIPDIIDGRPSIILGLIWTIILQYHIEELASSLSFDSRQSSMESLASLDSRSTLSSCRSASSSPLPPRGSPLHARFRVSAKKALLLWVREQCHRAGCTISVKDFKASWRSGVVFLAILYALRPDLVDLSKARTRSNKQNLEEAFGIAERELRVPRLLEPDDVDVRDPDEKSIMTYVAQFLQYSRELPLTEEEMQTQYLTPVCPSPVNLPVHYTPAISASPLRQATPDRKAQEVTCWLVQAYDELLEGWDSTEGESYSERYHVFQTFLVSFNEQRRPIMPLLTAMRRSPKLSEEQRALREAWDALTEKLREYRIELDTSLPAPLDAVARWLLRAEGALSEEQGDPQDHGRAADEAREKQELLKVCLEEMPQQLKTFQSFQNLDEFGNVIVPTDKIDELKRRFTGVRVTAKYHGVKLEYREQRHTVLDLLGQIRTKLRVWKRPFISPEAVRVLLQEWHELVNTQELTSLLEAALHKLKHISEKYSSKSALAADYQHVSQQVKQLEEDTAVVLEEVTATKSTMGRVLSAWDSYSDCLSSLQAWLEQSSAAVIPGHRPPVRPEAMAEWGSRQAHLNEVGNFLVESTDPQTSRSLSEELRRVNMHWADFVKKNTFDNVTEPGAEVQTRPQDPQTLIREATLILKEPLEATAGPLRTYRKRLQFIMRKLREVDLEFLSSEYPADQLQKLKLTIPEVMSTLCEAEQVCMELQHSVSGLESRLAELLHWETEARELYQLLRAAERQQHQRGQDPRARILISRGLQLEGQVVTEEQDLQVMVMTNQKSSPIQYLRATGIQDRVRAAVAQSQEAVGMLSSLGARRDRSRSPPEESPPPKVFIQAQEKPQNLRQLDARQPTQQPESKSVSHQRHGTFVPKILVQEYREQTTTSPPMPYSYADAVKQTRTKTPPEVQFQPWSMTAVSKQQQTQEPQQQQVEEQLYRQDEKELQQKQFKQKQQQEVEQQEPMPPQPQEWQQKQEQKSMQQQIEIHHCQVLQGKELPEPGKQPSLQQPAVENLASTSNELQSRKARAMKNRPWLQKPVSEDQKISAPHPEEESAQNLIQATQIQPDVEMGRVSVQVVHQHTGDLEPQPQSKAKATKQLQQKQKEQQWQTQQSQNQQQKERHPDRKEQQEQLPRPEKQPKQPEQFQQEQLKQVPSHSIPRQTQPDSDAKVTVLPQSQAESPDLCIKPPALAQAPPQAYTEAYTKAQALARNGFEEAKHCLQQHILEAINVFKDKCISAEQISVKEATLKTLDPELLDEFLRAAKGMEAFCTPSQLRDMEFFTQSVISQWEACFSVDGSFAQAGQHLEALRELCDTLSPEDAHRLAQTQLRECEKRLAAIQHQFSGDQDAPLPESRISVAFSEDVTAQKEHEMPQVCVEVSQVTMKTLSVEKREVEKQTSVEEEVTKKEASERYENCKKTLQAQLAKNEQSIKDVPSDAVSLKGLHTRLQEIQFLRQETESLWSEYGLLWSQVFQLSGNTGLEQEKAELQEQWRRQLLNLQRRGSSLGAALRQIDSTENHMVDFTDRMDRYLRQPKDITAFTLANTNILKDIKELDDNIQNELDQLSRLDPESSDLDPRDCFPLSREVETHRTSLDQLRQQVRKSKAAARALDRFLMSLRTVDEDISGVQGTPCSDAAVLQDGRSKLALIRQSIDSLKEKAPQLDLLLQGARLTITRDGVPASCLDMVTALLRRLEEADSGLAAQQRGLVKETQGKSLGLRKRALLVELRKLQDTIETQGLKEPTLPAVQHRLRGLSDLEGQIQSLHAELQNVRDLQEKQGGGEDLLQELETQWGDTHRGFSDRKKQYSLLLENLKKFQSCRSRLSSTMQRAEQTVSEQASYMGRDNLQRSMTKVRDIKEELGGLGEPIEEMRGVCKQLQTQLKKFPDCSESPYEAEAHTLMDNYLDVTEKTDAYMDNLRVGLELWDKQLMLGGEVDVWAGAKLALFAESHPFYNEQDVLTMRDEIHTHEENIEHFHKKSVEIQEMLQSQEAPLELQVMETQLRKRMEQVKELFTDCTDVFEELIAVKKHLAEKIDECQSAVESIQCSLSKTDASSPKVEEQIQDLVKDLQAQEEQAEAVLKEVALVSSVASSQVLEALSVDSDRLREAISRTKDMIHLKTEERDKGLLKVLQDERKSFEGWYQDLQLSVNECFENPESRADVETSLQRLSSFLKSNDAERRLEQLKVQLDRGSQQVPPEQLAELNTWLKEQREEVETFRSHCLNRQQQMESLLGDLNSLQKQHDSFREWLQVTEKQSAVSQKDEDLLKDLQDKSGRAEALRELLASLRRQGVRAESLLKDGDNLIQRYKNLEARLQKRAKTLSDLQGEHNSFNTLTESTRTWIRNLLRPLTDTDREAQSERSGSWIKNIFKFLSKPGTKNQSEEIKSTAQTILTSKPEGDSKLENLKSLSQSLCDHEDLDETRRQDIQRSLRDTEEQWREALQMAEDTLSEAEKQDLLDQDLDALKTLNESVQSWIRDQEEKLQSVHSHMQVEEKIQVAHDTLNSKHEGESNLQDLKQLCQKLCDNQTLDESGRREVQDVVDQTEEQWRKVMKAAEETLDEAERDATAQSELNAFKIQSEDVQSWMKEQKQRLLSLGGQTQFDERLQISQTVLCEGESKLLVLRTRGQSLRERLQESRRAEVDRPLWDTEQQWTSVVQAASLAELRSLSDDFDAQSKDTRAWVRERQQKMQSAGFQTPPEERRLTAQTILDARPDGDCKVNNLRRRGQSVCDHKDADEGRREFVQRAVKDTEDQWRTLLNAAQQVKGDAEAQVADDTERRTFQLIEFDTCHLDTGRWLEDIQQRLCSVSSQTSAEDRLHSAQDIMSCKPEGDSRLQELRRRGQSLCSLDVDDDQKRRVEEQVRAAEGRWAGAVRDAKETLERAEKQCSLEGQLRDYEVQRESTRVWLQDKQQSLVALESQRDPEKIIVTAQTILSSKPEGDAKLTELRRRSQSLSDQQDVEDDVKREARRTTEDSEEQWRTVLQSAESSLGKAEVQYSLSREAEALCFQAESTKAWVQDLQEEADAKGRGPRGSQAQIEDRLNTAQIILSSRCNAEARVAELKRRVQSLCEHKDLEDEKRLEVEQTVGDIEEQWRTLLQAAEDTQRELKDVVERQTSCRYKRVQAESRLSEIQAQASALPRLFPWPGLGERRQAVERARGLLEQSTALAPVLARVRAQAAELFEVTQDPDWADASWSTGEETTIPALLKELTETVALMVQGVMTERQCTQLVEQHEAAQDWLREHVKGLEEPPADRQGLHNTVNTLKALLQTVEREHREMKELDSARDDLLSLCTPGGRAALALNVGHLHDLCAASEQEVRRRLALCESRLEGLELQLDQRSRELKERAAALQWELRSLDQALTYSEPQNNIAQLQQHWSSLQNCEKSLEDLGVKVHDLREEVRSAPDTSELPAEIVRVVESLCQQHDSLKSRLNEHRGTCTTNTVRCLRECLDALQQWSQSKPSQTVSSVQGTLDEGEKLQARLREALSHHEFLTDCLTPVLFVKLERDGSETLGEAETHKSSLNWSLKDLEEEEKQRQHDLQSSDVQSISLKKTGTSFVAPPRKSKRSPEKKAQVKLQKPIPLTGESTSAEDVLSVSVEALQTETSAPKPDVTDSTEDAETAAEETSTWKSVSETITTTEEAQLKGSKPDVTGEPSEAAAGEPSLIQDVTETVVQEETTPVPSRRKTKTKTTVSSRPLILDGTRIPDPVKTDVEDELTKKVHEIPESLTEQVKTTAEPGQSGEEAMSLEVSQAITDAETKQLKDDFESPTLLTSEPVTETDAEQPKSGLQTQELESSELSTVSEPFTAQTLIADYFEELQETKKEPDDGETSIVQVTIESTETASVEERRLLPSEKQVEDTKTETPEADIVEESKGVPPRKKYKSGEPVSGAEESTCVVKVSEKFLTTEFVPGLLERAASETIEILLPKRKSKGPTRSQKHTDQLATHMEGEPESQPSDLSLKEQTESAGVASRDEEPKDNKKEYGDLKTSSITKEVTERTEMTVKEYKLSPTKRRPKGPKLSPAHGTKGVGDTKQLPDSQEPSREQTENVVEGIESQSLEVSTVMEKMSPHDRTVGAEEPEKTPIVTEFGEGQAEFVVVEKSKLSPPRRKSKRTELPLKPADDETPQALEEPEGQKPVVISSVQKEKALDILPASDSDKSADVASEHITEADQKSSTPDEATSQILPARRKSKSPNVSPELSPMEETQAVEKLDSQKTEAAIVEEPKALPSRRKSKSPKVSPEAPRKEETQAIDQTDSQITEAAIVEEPKVIPKRKSKKGPDSPKLSSTEPTGMTVEVKGKLSPSKRKTKVPELSPEVVTKDEAQIVKEPELQTLMEQTETDVTTTRAPVCDITVAAVVEFKEGGNELEIHKSTSTGEAVTEATEITAIDESKVLPSRRKTKSPKVSPEPSLKEKKQTMEKPDSQITEAAVVEEPKVVPNTRKSKKVPASPKPSSTTEVDAGKTEITVVEKGKLSPTKRKTKALKVSPELFATVRANTNEESESQMPSSGPEDVTESTDISMMEKGTPDVTVVEETMLIPTEVCTVPEAVSAPERPAEDGKKTCTDDEKPVTTSEIIAEKTEIAIVEETKPISQEKDIKSDITQTFEIKPVHPVAERDSTQTTTLESEVTEMSPTEQEIIKLSESMSHLKLVATTLKKQDKEQVSDEPLKPSYKETCVIEKSESQITEAVVMDEPKVKPNKRRSKKSANGKKPSSVVTTLTKMTEVEKEILSPEVSFELANKDQIPTEKIEDQMSSKMQTDVAVVEETTLLTGEISNTFEVCAVPEVVCDLERPTDVEDKESTKELDIVESAEVATEKSETADVEEAKPTSQGVTNLVTSIARQLIETAGEIQTSLVDMIISQVGVSDANREVRKEVVVPTADTHQPQLESPTSHPQDEPLESKGDSKKALDQTIDAPHESEDIDNLLKETTEIQRRYLILDVTRTTQAQEIKPGHPEAEGDTTHEAEADVTLISPTEQQIIQLSESMSHLKLIETTKKKDKVDKKHGVILQLDKEETAKEPKLDITETSTEREEGPEKKERTSPDKPGVGVTEINVQVSKTEYSVQEQPSTLLLHDVDKPPKSLDENTSIEKIHTEPEVCVIQLDVQTTTEAQQPIINIQTNAQEEKEPGVNALITVDVKPEDTAGGVVEIKVQERKVESQTNVVQMDSAPPAESLQACDTEQEVTETSMHEESRSEMVTLKSKEEKPKEMHPETSIHVTKSLDEKMVTTHVEREIRVIQLDMPTTFEEHEKTHVKITKELKTDVQTQSDNGPPNKDETVADEHSEGAAEKTKEIKSVTEVIIKDHKITCVAMTEEPGTEREQTTALSETVPQDKENEDQTDGEVPMVEVRVEKLDKEEPQEAQETICVITPKEPQADEDASLSLDETSVIEEKVDIEPEVCVVQPGITCIIMTEETRIDAEVIALSGKLPDDKEKPDQTDGEVTIIEVSVEKLDNDEPLKPDKTVCVTTPKEPQEDEEGPQSLDETSVIEEKVLIEPEVCVVQPGITCIVTTEGTRIDKEKPDQADGEVTMIELRVEKLDKNEPPEADETICVIVAEKQEDGTQSDAIEPSSVDLSAAQLNKTLPEITLPEQEFIKEGHAQLLEPKMHDVSKSQDVKSESEHELKTVTTEKDPALESSIQLETVTESKEMIPTDFQPDNSTVEMSMVEEKDKAAESLPELGVTDEAQTDKDKTDATEKEEEPARPIQDQQTKTGAEVDLQDIPFPVATTDEVKIQMIDSSKQEFSAEVKLSPAQRPVSEAVLDEITQVGGLPAQENKEENVMTMEKLVVEVPECSAMRNVFTEIQPLVGTGRSIQEEAPETLVTPTNDMEACLHRLVAQILSCKNRPADLSPTAMARQVEEAQQCRDAAQAQVSLLCHLRGADAENGDVLDDQWSATAQDAAAVIHSKEAELQLVNDYCGQIQTIRTTVERQAAELDDVKTSPEQSSSKEAEKLCSIQKNMEANRTVFGDLLLIFTKLCPHLSQSERASAHAEQKNLLEKWRGLERATERNLHHANVTSHEISSIQAQTLTLQEHLDAIEKDLEGKSPSVTQWNCRKAQQLMEANAEVKAAQQRYLYLLQILETLLLSSRWEAETKEVQQRFQTIEDKLNHTEELVSTHTQTSSNPVMEKIITVMNDGLVWAKQTESDIEGRRRRVPLLPEEVHHQLRDLKKLQSEVMGKQGQLELLVEEVTELLPQLDQSEEVPMVRASLQTLDQLSNSTSDKLAAAVREIESGLQTREKMSEQIADLDSWVMAHLHREASRAEDGESRSQAELERRARQIQETLTEADKLAAVCEALLMKSRDISSELSVSENCQLFEKLSNLQEDIRAISSYEKTNKKELDEVLQTVDSNKKNLDAIEQSLRQMMLDLSRHRFPITTESLQPLKPFKNQILEHKSQIDLLQPWIAQEKAVELHTVISEIHNKIINLETKSRDHERYLNMRKRVEELRDQVQDQVRQTKEDSKGLKEKYKICQTLLIQLPLVKWFCEEAHSELQTIISDLYPSQQSAEKQRLKQTEENLDMWQIMLYNNLSIIEWDLLKELDLESVKKDTQVFLVLVQQQLQKHTELEPHEAAVSEEYQRVLSLKKTMESKMRVVEILEQKKGKRKDGKQDLTVLRNSVLSDCDSRMESVLQARESLRGYTSAVKRAALFLKDVEVSLLPPHSSAGLCSERLEEIQKALSALQQQFQTHVEQLQSQFSLHNLLSPQKAEQLQENILSQLLVRMSSLQAKGHHQLESLSRCAEHHRTYIKCGDELIQRVKSAEESLLQFISQKPTCLSDCTDQEAKLAALCEEEESLLRRMYDMKEWCPEPSCRGGREAAVTAVWKRVTRLWRCTRELAARSKQRIVEWTEVNNSVENASTVLDQVEAELPDTSQVKASAEELHDLLQSWEQYQDRLDCEHRSLSALELRAARMLGVPAHLEEAPPTPLCQRLQAMQARYGSVKQRSREGLEATRSELEHREKVQKDLQGVRVWLQAADALLSEMERNNSTQELQEVHSQLYTQKALLQRIMESLKMKYSDMDTPIPVEIEGQMQEVTQSLQGVEVKVGKAVERSGPVHRLGAKLSELQAGLRSVQDRLDQRSPTVIEAKVTQKRVWDELDVWHSCLASVEVDMQDLDKPEEALSLTEKLVEVQQLHSQLSKRAEQRTTLLSKTHTWLQEHREMISSSKSWMAEAQSWLAAPCTYTTSKCLSSHVQSLQMVLSDSAQIRTTLQGFSSVLQEMSQVCEVTALKQQLLDADHQVAEVQDGFTAPLAHLQHAAAEVEAIESEVRRMENDVTEIKTSLSSPEAFPSPREEHLKGVERRIQSMRKTVAEIQRCKPGLCLPEKAEETLTVFSVVDQLQTQLLELEKKVPALFIQQPATPVQTKAQSAEQKTSEVEDEKEDAEDGHIKIVHVEDDVLRRSGAALLTVERSTPEQRRSPDPAQEVTEVSGPEVSEAPEAAPEVSGPEESEAPEAAPEVSGPEESEAPEAAPEVSGPEESEAPEAAAGQGSEHSPEETQVTVKPHYCFSACFSG